MKLKTQIKYGTPRLHLAFKWNGVTISPFELDDSKLRGWK